MTTDRRSHLSHLLLEVLCEQNAVDDGDRNQVLKKIKIYIDKVDQKFDMAMERAQQKGLCMSSAIAKKIKLSSRRRRVI